MTARRRRQPEQRTAPARLAEIMAPASDATCDRCEFPERFHDDGRCPTAAQVSLATFCQMTPAERDRAIRALDGGAR